MRRLLWFVLMGLAVSSPSLTAMGLGEDPQERLTKTWSLEAVRTLEFRGEVRFKLVPGPEPRVTVETTRALFDQLTVSNWFGAATVAIESGLRGPREDGTVEILIELPALVGLAVLDRSSGTVTWPGTEARLRVGENSSVELVFEGESLHVEASWLSVVVAQGRTHAFTVVGRHQARVEAAELTVASAQVTLDERSSLLAGPGWKATGTARHGSRVTVPERSGWELLVLREESVLNLAPQ